MSATPITGFHQDPQLHWVADLACGHAQHVRHDPPWQLRPWVLTEAGRTGMLGGTLDCKLCDGAQNATVAPASSEHEA